MTQHQTLRILITGEHDEPAAQLPQVLPEDGTRLEWFSLPVLQFDRLKVDPDLVERLVRKPVEWIIFTSPRSVRFWSEVLMDQGYDFPTETQVACIGEKTATVAGEDGFNPDFFPTEPGTEKFLEEFEDLISNNSIKPTVFIPMAEGGRLTIRNRLRELGCEVTTASLYRTSPRDDLRQALSESELEKTNLVLFTSPSSVDAFTKVFQIPAQVKIASLGHYTARHLELKGFSDQRMLPAGDFQRIGEVLR
jgi:uroporphyrinogen-III synthase